MDTSTPLTLWVHRTIQAVSPTDYGWQVTYTPPVGGCLSAIVPRVSLGPGDPVPPVPRVGDRISLHLVPLAGVGPYQYHRIDRVVLGEWTLHLPYELQMGGPLPYLRPGHAPDRPHEALS